MLVVRSCDFSLLINDISVKTHKVINNVGANTRPGLAVRISYNFINTAKESCNSVITTKLSVQEIQQPLEATIKFDPLLHDFIKHIFVNKKYYVFMRLHDYVYLKR